MLRTRRQAALRRLAIHNTNREHFCRLTPRSRADDTAAMALYNRIAAQDLGRIAALSDGIFAFAATVLVLEIRLPEKLDIHSEADLWMSLAAMAPRMVTWLLSLMTL